MIKTIVLTQGLKIITSQLQLGAVAGRSFRKSHPDQSSGWIFQKSHPEESSSRRVFRKSHPKTPTLLSSCRLFLCLAEYMAAARIILRLVFHASSSSLYSFFQCLGAPNTSCRWAPLKRRFEACSDKIVYIINSRSINITVGLVCSVQIR